MERKYVQIMKSTGYVNLVGDESVGMTPTDNDVVWIFDISAHPQNEEIVSYMKYDSDTDTFYVPEPEPMPEPEPDENDEVRAILNGERDAEL